MCFAAVAPGLSRKCMITDRQTLPLERGLKKETQELRGGSTGDSCIYPVTVCLHDGESD